jgi:hexosaminidase
MRIFLFLKTLLIIVLISSCSDQQTNNSKHPNGSELAIKWELQSSVTEGDKKSKASFTITNNSSQVLDNQGWTMYYSQMPSTIIAESIPAEILVEHISGDFYKFYPTEVFKPLEAGKSFTFSYEKSELTNSISDAPVGLYVVFEGSEPEVITDYHALPMTKEALGNVNIPTAESRYEENNYLSKLDKTTLPKIIPRPASFKPGNGELTFKNQILVNYIPELENEATFLSEFMTPLFTGEIQFNFEKSPIEQRINLKINPLLKTPESYILNISGQTVDITGADAAGVFYGIQSFLALLPIDLLKKSQSEFSVDYVSIQDAPRFPYRGMHLDVSRNFHSKETVKKLLDLMSFYKLNKFHFHITDDEAWRLEIDGLPELTGIGGKRGHTIDERQNLYPAYGSGPFVDPENGYGTGFYSKNDFIEILKYANHRHIEVIPEIDVPGHARATIKAMESRYHRLVAGGKPEEAKEFLLNDFDDKSEYSSAQFYNDNVICVCQESSFNFIEKVIEEIVSMYKNADAPLTAIHIGGDELPQGSWTKSPVCDQFLADHPEIGGVEGLHPYFSERFFKILSKYDLNTAGWEEIVLVEGENGSEPNKAFLDKKMQAYVWNAVWGWGGEDMAYKIANTGFPVVMCNASNLYFDLAYNTDPEEPGLNWAGYVDTKSPFALAPLNILKTATVDRYNNPLDLEKVAEGKVSLSEKGKQHFSGIQSELWSETVRGPEALEYMVYPKILATAERAWAQSPNWLEIENREQRMAALEKDWNIFTNMIGQLELARLDHLYGGLNYRIPLPGAIIEKNELKANVRFPGLTIRYTTNGSEPNFNSEVYSEPIEVSGTIKLKAFNKEGRSSRTSTVSK